MLYFLTRQDFQPKWRVIDVVTDTPENRKRLQEEMARRASENPARYYRIVPYALKALYPTINY